MTNPFESPKSVSEPEAAPMMGAGQMPRSGLVRQVPVVAILMMVHGVLISLAGLGLLAFAVFMPQMMRSSMRDAMENQQGVEMQESMEQAQMFMLVIYGGLGSVILVAGGLSIFAGIRNLRYQNRVLGIVALGVGFVTVFTCYCAPTALGLGVYGLIVLLNSDVALAFQLREQGCTTDQIKYGDW